MKVVQYAAPSIEPVSIPEQQYHISLNSDVSPEDDSMIEDNIKSAREHVENITRRALLTQTWDYYLDRFPAENAFKLPFGNLKTVTHVKYTDSAGTQTTMTAGTDYIVETNGDQCGRIVLPYGVSWPSFTAYPSNPIVVRYVCGWTTAVSVPSTIRSAVKMIALDLYENREAQQFSNGGMEYRENVAVTNLLASARIWDEFL